MVSAVRQSEAGILPPGQRAACAGHEYPFTACAWAQKRGLGRSWVWTSLAKLRAGYRGRLRLAAHPDTLPPQSSYAGSKVKYC
jgi:hypothetical protein